MTSFAAPSKHVMHVACQITGARSTARLLAGQRQSTFLKVSVCDNAKLMADYRVQGARARLLAGQRQSTCPEGSSARACASDSTAPCMMRMPLERSNGRNSERRTAVSLHGTVTQKFNFLRWTRVSTTHSFCINTEHRQSRVLGHTAPPSANMPLL